MEPGCARTWDAVLLGCSGNSPWNGNIAPVHDQHGRYICRTQAAGDIANPYAYHAANRDANANDDPNVDPIPNIDSIPHSDRDTGTCTDYGLVSESYYQSLPIN
mgnify:CR=1 FL=1